MPKWWDDLMKKRKSEDKPAAKPEPKDLGSGYAKDSAEKAKKHNEEVEKTMQSMDSYKKGGRVRRDGPAMLHKDEVVIPSPKKKGKKK